MAIKAGKGTFGFTSVEFITAVIIIVTLIGTSALYFKRALASFREVALKNQLTDIRLNLKLYRLFHDNYPDDIRVLLSEEVDMAPYSNAVLKKKYIESIKSDREGFPLDPFGNRFVYRSDIGEVRSQTKGYEDW